MKLITILIFCVFVTFLDFFSSHKETEIVLKNHALNVISILWLYCSIAINQMYFSLNSIETKINKAVFSRTKTELKTTSSIFNILFIFSVLSQLWWVSTNNQIIVSLCYFLLLFSLSVFLWELKIIQNNIFAIQPLLKNTEDLV